MKIRIDDEYSNLGEDLNIVFGEYCENDISKQEDGTFGKESSCYNNNDSIYERSNNNEFDMEIQNALGADIIMAFDQCVEHGATYEYTKQLLLRNKSIRLFMKKNMKKSVKYVKKIMMIVVAKLKYQLN